MRKIFGLLAIVLSCYGVASAQERTTIQGKGLPDSLFSLQLVLESKEQIGLTQDQLNSLEKLSHQIEIETRETGELIAPVSEKLLKLLNSSQVKESDAMSLVEIIVDLERQYRAKQILYLIQMKNVLSENQQQQLEELRSRNR